MKISLPPPPWEIIKTLKRTFGSKEIEIPLPEKPLFPSDKPKLPGAGYSVGYGKWER